MNNFDGAAFFLLLLVVVVVSSSEATRASSLFWDQVSLASSFASVDPPMTRAVTRSLVSWPTCIPSHLECQASKHGFIHLSNVFAAGSGDFECQNVHTEERTPVLSHHSQVVCALRSLMASFK